MRMHKFIKSVQSVLVSRDTKTEAKKESLKNFLKKLNTRKTSIIKSLESSLKKKEKKEFQEDLDIISLQIKKGERLLHTLSSEK